MLLGLGECSACLIQVGAFFLVATSGSALTSGEPAQFWIRPAVAVGPHRPASP